MAESLRSESETVSGGRPGYMCLAQQGLCAACWLKAASACPAQRVSIPPGAAVHMSQVRRHHAGRAAWGGAQLGLRWECGRR